MDETEIVRVAENLASRALNRVITQPTPNDSSNTDGGGAVHSGVEIVPGIFGVASVPTSAAMTAKQKASCGCGVDVLGDEHRDWLSRSSFRYSRSALARETTARVQRLAENPDDTMNLVRAALSVAAAGSAGTDSALRLLARALQQERTRGASPAVDSATTAACTLLLRKGLVDDAASILKSALSADTAAQVCAVCIAGVAPQALSVINTAPSAHIGTQPLIPQQQPPQQSGARIFLVPREEKLAAKQTQMQLHALMARRLVELARVLSMQNQLTDAIDVAAAARAVCLKRIGTAASCPHTCTRDEALQSLSPADLCAVLMQLRGAVRRTAVDAIWCESRARESLGLYISAELLLSGLAGFEVARFGRQFPRTHRALLHVRLHSQPSATAVRSWASLARSSASAAVWTLPCLMQRLAEHARRWWGSFADRVLRASDRLGLRYVVPAASLVAVFVLVGVLSPWLAGLIQRRFAPESALRPAIDRRALQRSIPPAPVQPLFRAASIRTAPNGVSSVQSAMDAEARAVEDGVNSGDLLFAPSDVRLLGLGPRGGARQPRAKPAPDLHEIEGVSNWVATTNPFTMPAS